MKKILLTVLLCFSALANAQEPTKRIEFEAPGTYPEGIAYDKAGDVFYVSSARLGTIGKVTRDGNYTPFYTDASLKSTYGLKVSPDCKWLYACAGDANYSKFSTSATKKKEARLLVINIKTGKKDKDIDLSGLVAAEHFPNDVALDDKGNAYITDSFANAIYKVDTKGAATLFSNSEIFKAAGVGLNGLVWHPSGFVIAADGGKGCLYKVEVANPKNVSKVIITQFFPNADGLLLNNNNTLTLVQNGGANKVFRISTTDNWKTAKVTASTSYEDRFAFPSTAAVAGNDTWIMNANFSEIAEGNNVASKKFSLQQAVFRAMP